ncbi:MAG: cation:proton antiporter [Abditibacteriota bacterium]|nr:cation:proton antiporter [Abditibacteriota bacterium]
MPNSLTLSLLYIILGITLLSLVSNKLKLPLIIGYIIAGILLGDAGFKLIQLENVEVLHLISDLGLTFLLFIVGLKLDITSLKSMKSAFLLGVLKIIVIMGLGFALSLALGFGVAASLIIGCGLSFSSTIVIVKILSDKGDLDSLPGRVAMGTLIVEDIAAVVALIVINTMSGNGSSLTGQLILMGKNVLILFLIVFLVGKFIIPKFLKTWAKSPELLMVISIFFAIIFAAMCDDFGFSKEVGAFIAGMMFAPHKEFRGMISSKLASIRDITLIFFFVDFGLLVKFDHFSHLLPKILIFVAFSVLMKPIIAYILMNYMKYKKTTALKTGLILSQISEFSLIIVAMGIYQKLIDNEILTIIGVTLIISIFLSSFLINYMDNITSLLTAKFKFVDNKWQRESSFESLNSVPSAPFNNLIIGADSFGTALYEDMVETNRPVLSIDFDPINVAAARAEGKNIVYGDITDRQFLNTINFKEMKWVINTVADANHKEFMGIIKKYGFTGLYAAKTDMENYSKEDLEKLGVDLIFEPYINAAKEAFYMILDRDEMIKKEKMRTDIAKLRDHYIICGYGRMGRQVATDFQNENIPFVVVEDNPENIDELNEKQYYHIIGKAENDEILKAAGIENAKGLIAVSPTDELNVFIVLTARNLNKNLDIVARSILEGNKDKLKSAGANKVISPYVFGGRKIASAVLRPTVFEFNEKTYHGNDYDITFEELKLNDDSSFIGKSLVESNFRKTYGVTIVAIKRADGEFITNPSFDLIFEKGDILVVIANAAEVHKLENSSDFNLVNGKNLEN